MDPMIQGLGSCIPSFSICLTSIKNWSTSFLNWYVVFRDISDTAVTIFTMTEAMLMKLQVSFKNYLEFSVENEAKRHCVKSVRIRSYSGPHFPAFGLNTKRYYVSLRIQSKCWKMRTRITPKADTFYAVRGMQRNLKSTVLESKTATIW